MWKPKSPVLPIILTVTERRASFYTNNMAKKKKKATSSKKKSTSNALFEGFLQNYTPPPAEAFKSVHEKHVKVHIRLLNWTYLNFDVRVKETTTIHVIYQKILEQHGGSLHQIDIYKEQINPRCLIKDYTKTLKDVFQFDDLVKQMKQQDENATDSTATQDTSNDDFECVIYYDFKPFKTECPLLLCEPRLTTLVADDKKKPAATANRKASKTPATSNSPIV